MTEKKVLSSPFKIILKLHVLTISFFSLGLPNSLIYSIYPSQEMESVKQLTSMLVDRCREFSTIDIQDEFMSLLQDESIQLGFLLNERFINLPPQLALPSFESLWYV